MGSKVLVYQAGIRESGNVVRSRERHRTCCDILLARSSYAHTVYFDLGSWIGRYRLCATWGRRPRRRLRRTELRWWRRVSRWLWRGLRRIRPRFRWLRRLRSRIRRLLWRRVRVRLRLWRILARLLRRVWRLSILSVRLRRLWISLSIRWLLWRLRLWRALHWRRSCGRRRVAAFRRRPALKTASFLKC